MVKKNAKSFQFRLHPRCSSPWFPAPLASSHPLRLRLVGSGCRSLGLDDAGAGCGATGDVAPELFKFMADGEKMVGF